MIIAGIDLGTSYIRLITKDGLVFNEKCRVAFDRQNRCLAIGKEAKDYMDMEDEGIYVVNPLTVGNIQLDALATLLEQLCSDYSLFRFFQKTILVVSYPTSISESNLNDLQDILLELGAFKVYLEKEIWVAAIGSKLDLFLPVASCILNIGSTNCDIAAFAGGKMISKSSLNIAGQQISTAIDLHFRHQQNIQLSQRTIEKAKKQLSQVITQEEPDHMSILGVNLINGHNTYFKINENMLVPIISPYIHHWAMWIQDYFSSLPSSYRDDILKKGIICCGGSVKIRGFQEKLAEEIGCPVYLTDDPLNTVGEGLITIIKRLSEG